MIIIWSTVEVNLAIVSSNNPSLYLSIGMLLMDVYSLPSNPQANPSPPVPKITFRFQ